MGSGNNEARILRQYSNLELQGHITDESTVTTLLPAAGRQIIQTSTSKNSFECPGLGSRMQRLKVRCALNSKSTSAFPTRTRIQTTAGSSAHRKDSRMTASRRGNDAKIPTRDAPPFPVPVVSSSSSSSPVAVLLSSCRSLLMMSFPSSAVARSCKTRVSVTEVVSVPANKLVIT